MLNLINIFFTTVGKSYICKFSNFIYFKNFWWVTIFILQLDYVLYNIKRIIFPNVISVAFWKEVLYMSVLNVSVIFVTNGNIHDLVIAVI